MTDMSHYNFVANDNACSTWTRDEDKIFERALVTYPEGYPHRWELISTHLPGKTADNVRDHYTTLISDVNTIEFGSIELPIYPEDSFSPVEEPHEVSFGTTPKNPIPKKAKAKPNPWTKEEQELFLMGLKIYGKGDWRNISRNVVTTRSATQVASHAQKYFLRHKNNSVKKARKRSSIHDITLPDEAIIAPHLPIHFSMPESSMSNVHSSPRFDFSMSNIPSSPRFDISMTESSMSDMSSPPLFDSSMLESFLFDAMQQEQQQGDHQIYNIPTSY